MIMQQVFFTDNELKELTDYKIKSGMSYVAILKKAFDYYTANDLPYIKSDYIFYSKIGQERKQRKGIGISAELNNELTEFCNKHNYSKSAVAAQAILAFIRKDN